MWTKRHSKNAVDRPFALYCLCERGRSGIRYFGITKQSPSERMAAHVYDVKTGMENYKTRWMKSVLDGGGEVSMQVLRDGLSESEATRLEGRMISLFKIAFRLTNTGPAGIIGGCPRKFVPDITIRVIYRGETIYRKSVKNIGHRIVSVDGKESKRRISRDIEMLIRTYGLD